MKIDATPNAAHPTHHVSLSDGTTTIGLNLAGGSGRLDPTLLQRSAYPRTSTQIRQGSQKYSDLELPYKNTAQDNWSGGRGQDALSDDVSKYLEAYRVDTSINGQAHLGGLDTWTSGYKDDNIAMPGDVNRYALTATYDYVSRSFSASASYTTGSIFVWCGVNGTPANDLTVAIYSDDGDPNVSLASATLAASAFPFSDGRMQLVELSISQALTGSTTYWVVISSEGSTAGNGWLVGTDMDTSGKASADGSTWATVASTAPYYVLGDNSTGFAGLFFEYKRGMYFVTQPNDGSTSALYINGDRGAADSNSGDKSLLNDAAKSWATDKWIGAIVLVTNGPGAEERQPWRTITDSAGTSLTVSPNWNVAHTTSTEYVILSSDEWTLVSAGLADYATDVTVARNWVYFAYGTNNVVSRWEAYNSSGTWTDRNTTESVSATYVKIVRDNTNGVDVLWGGYNDQNYGGSGVWKGWVPPVGGDVFSPLRELHEIGKIWSAVDANTTIARSTTVGEENTIKITLDSSSVADGEVWAGVEFDNGVVLDDAYGLVYQFQPNFSLGGSSLQLKMFTDSGMTLDEKILADYVFHFDKAIPPDSFQYFDATDYDEIQNMAISDTDFTFKFTLLTTEYFYIGATSRFDLIRVAVGGLTNATAATLDVEYWEADVWASFASITDGTASAGAPFAQDGDIAYTMATTWDKGGDEGAKTLSESYYWARISTDINLDDASMATMLLENGTDDHSELNQRFYDLTAAHDADALTSALLSNFTTDDYLYIGHSSKRFDRIGVDLGLVFNAVTSAMTVEVYDGAVFTAVSDSDGTISSGKTLAVDGEVQLSGFASDWPKVTLNGVSAYWARIKVSADLTTNMTINEIYIRDYISNDRTHPSVSSGVWEWVEHTNISNTTLGRAGICYGLGLEAAGTFSSVKTVKVRGKIYLTRQSLEYIPLGDGAKVTGIEAYGEGHQNPWVLTESQVYEIQTESGDIPVPIPLGEIASLRAEGNGKAAAVNDVFIYFNLGEHVERYFNRSLENVGFNTGEGLPNNRRGDVSSLLSYPGRVYATVAATDSNLLSGGYCSVLVREGGGWHEVYRAPKGNTIYSVATQVIPGDSLDRMWIQVGSWLVWVPLPSNTFDPTNDSNYVYTHEGWMITSWLDMGFLDVPKLIKSIKLYTESLGGAGNETIKISYQTESGSIETGWTNIPNTITTSPFKEEDLAALNNVTARRIRFRFFMTTEDKTSSPVLKAYILESILTLSVKHSYNLPFYSADMYRDLSGVTDKDVLAETVVKQLDTWASSPPTVLTFRCNFPLYDNKTVVVQPPGTRATVTETTLDYEEYGGEVTLLEV